MTTTRNSILRAATKLLDQSGPDGVTLRGVAQIAGLSHNAPYKHFQDKEALLAGVAARELRARAAAMITAGLQEISHAEGPDQIGLLLRLFSLMTKAPSTMRTVPGGISTRVEPSRTFST